MLINICATSEMLTDPYDESELNIYIGMVGGGVQRND